MQVRLTDLHSKPSFCSYSIDTDFFFFHFFFPFKPFSGVFSLSLSLCAYVGLVGTTICIEDLFYNMPIRKKALKSTSEELARVLEVVGRYAIFHDGVGITLKRYGQQRPDVCTNQKDTKLEKIRSVFGSQLGSNLLHFKAGSGDEEEDEGKVVDEETFVFSADGYASSANYSKVLKRTVTIMDES